MNQPATQVARLNSEVSGDSNFSDVMDRMTSPCVFLMTNSFDTGGSERQFVELVRALQPTKYRVTVGCLQANDPLQGGLGPVEHFDLGGSLYRFESMRTRSRL